MQSGWRITIKVDLGWRFCKKGLMNLLKFMKQKSNRSFFSFQICSFYDFWVFIETYYLLLGIQERKEREALAAEGGWTVVTHHKGRKKTTEAESGTVVGSVSQTALEIKMSKKKTKEVGLDFYRFQKREAKRNGMPMTNLLCTYIYVEIDILLLEFNFLHDQIVNILDNI